MEVKAVLKGETLKKFLSIKKANGLNQYSETVRLCINNTYDNLEKKEA